MGRSLAIFLLLIGTAEASNIHPTPVPTATPAAAAATATPQPTATPVNTPVPTATAVPVVPTATPLQFGTNGVIPIFGATEFGSYAGSACPTPGVATTLSTAGALGCATPVPTATVVPTPTPGNTPVPTATVVPTATPAPTATPGSGGGLTNSARVWNSTGATISNNTATAVAFDTESGTYYYDSGGFHDNSTNNSRLTVPATGKYHIGCQINWTANTTGIRFVGLRVGGSDYIKSTEFNPASASTTDMDATTDVNLSATNYVECIVLQTSGGNLAIDGTARSPVFYATQVQ